MLLFLCVFCFLFFLSVVNQKILLVVSNVVFVSEMLSERIPVPKIDEGALKQLTDMGFPQSRAKKALILNKSVHMLSIVCFACLVSASMPYSIGCEMHY
jgi:hypothetical protein